VVAETVAVVPRVATVVAAGEGVVGGIDQTITSKDGTTWFPGVSVAPPSQPVEEPVFAGKTV